LSGLPICTFDLETSALEAVGAGFLLCAVVKPLDEKPKIFRYDSPPCRPGHETRLVKDVLAELSKYDILVGHNTDKFDLNYLKSRALVLGIPYNIHAISYDTLKAFRRIGYLSRPNGFGKPSAGLAVVADMLGVTTDENDKTSIQPRAHWKAVWQEGEDRRKAMNKIIDHCVRDVRLNEEVFKVLWRVDQGMHLSRL
jgi:hypothetical protein